MRSPPSFDSLYTDADVRVFFCGILPSFILFLDTSACVINYLGRGINTGFEVDQRNLHGRLMIMITYCLPRSDYDYMYVHSRIIIIISNRCSYSFVARKNNRDPLPHIHTHTHPCQMITAHFMWLSTSSWLDFCSCFSFDVLCFPPFQSKPPRFTLSNFIGGAAEMNHNVYIYIYIILTLNIFLSNLINKVFTCA